MAVGSQLVDSIRNETLFHTLGNGNISLGETIVRGRELASLVPSPPDHLLAAEIEKASLPAEDDAPLIGNYEYYFWVLIFSLMVLIATGGNTIVVYIVSTNKEMKSVTNYFLVNLSLADTMVSTLNVIFNFISMLNNHWPFGQTYCKISNFIAILSISASVFTLTAISCDRYNAILHPLQPRMSHRRAIGWILLIWSLSAALAMPNAIFSRVEGNDTGLNCMMVWPDGKASEGKSSYDHLYNFIILIVTYWVPILTMAILYYKVGKELWGYEAIGENIDKQKRALLAKKKIVKMMIVVVIIFALCWLPYHAFFLVSYYFPAMIGYERLYLIMYWLAMSNSMYNPIIIYFMNSKFRHEFRKILCFWLFCRIYTPTQRSTVNSSLNFTVTAIQTTASVGGGGGGCSSGGGHRGRLFARKAIENGRDNDKTTQITLLDNDNNNNNSIDSAKSGTNLRPLTPTTRGAALVFGKHQIIRESCNQLEENPLDRTAATAHTKGSSSSRTNNVINDLITTSVTNSKPSEKLIDLVNGCKSSASNSSNVSHNQDQNNNNKVWI